MDSVDVCFYFFSWVLERREGWGNVKVEGCGFF